MMSHNDRKYQSQDPHWRSVYTCRDHMLGNGCSLGNTIRIEVIEMDFFGLFLMQSPSEALMAKDEDRQAKLAALQVRIGNLDAQIERASDLIMELPVDELKRKLATWNSERLAAQKEMNTVRYGSRLMSD